MHVLICFFCCLNYVGALGLMKFAPFWSRGAPICDEFHPMCVRDVSMLPNLLIDLSNTSDYEQRLNQCSKFHHNKRKGRRLHLMTIPRHTGGADEALGGGKVQNNEAFRFRTNLLAEGTPNFYVELQHPIERLILRYHELKQGQQVNHYQERQRHFCKEGTGRKYAIDCVPKLSLYNFIAGEHANGDQENYSYEEALGSEANFMFEWLKPTMFANIADVKDFLMERFALIGDAAQPEQSQLQRALFQESSLEAALERAKDEQDQQKSNQSLLVHKPMDYFSEVEYSRLVMRHSKDIELYYWAVQQMNALTSCFRNEYGDEAIMSSSNRTNSG